MTHEIQNGTGQTRQKGVKSSKKHRLKRTKRKEGSREREVLQGGSWRDGTGGKEVEGLREGGTSKEGGTWREGTE